MRLIVVCALVGLIAGLVAGSLTEYPKSEDIAIVTLMFSVAAALIYMAHHAAKSV